jgi:hypothetical protein
MENLAFGLLLGTNGRAYFAKEMKFVPEHQPKAIFSIKAYQEQTL